MNRPFKPVGYLGLSVILMSLVLLMVFPSQAPWMMDGFFTPILAFEFVASKSEISQMFGFSGALDQQRFVAAMDLGNRRV